MEKQTTDSFVFYPLLLGVFLATVFLGIIHIFFSSYEVEIFALFLALTACVYGGCALVPNSQHFGIIELSFTALIFLFSFLGLIFSPLYLAIGYLLHGIWDYFHHSKWIKTPVVTWFPPACAIFDFIVAAAIFLRLH